HHHRVGFLGPVLHARVVPADDLGVLRGVFDAGGMDGIEDEDLHRRNGTPLRAQTASIFSSRLLGSGIPFARRSARLARSGSPGTSTGSAGSIGGVACSTSMASSRSASNAPSGRNAFGSIARKKCPSRSGSPGP